MSHHETSICGRDVPPARRCVAGPSGSPHRDDRGSSLLAVLMLLGLGVTLAGVLTVVSTVEVRLAAADRSAAEARYAAESAIDRVLIDLQATSSWSDVLSGVMGSSFAVGATTVSLADGRILDLVAEGAAMQARTSAAIRRGLDTPRWVLFGWGPMSAIMPPATDLESSFYLAVWVADDEAEADGRPDEDTNQALWVRAVAYGPGGTRQAIEALVTRSQTAPAPLRRIVWREALATE